MGYETIQTQIVNRLKTIEGIKDGAAQVRTGYQRAITPEEFEELFQVNLQATPEEIKPINAWLVIYESASASRPASLQSLIVQHQFAIVGFRSYNKDSDAAIRRVANQILDSFAVYLTLGLYDVNIENTKVEDVTIEITRFGYQSLGPVFCSKAELLLGARERRVPVTWET